MTDKPRFSMGWYNGFSPEERRASIPLQRVAMKTGRMPKPSRCTICGFIGHPDPAHSNRLGWHNETYDTPLVAHQICRWCHGALHGRFDRSARWLALVRRYGDGKQWFERLTMDPASQWRPLSETYADGAP
jgi:hypothetical protein